MKANQISDDCSCDELPKTDQYSKFCLCFSENLDYDTGDGWTELSEFSKQSFRENYFLLAAATRKEFSAGRAPLFEGHSLASLITMYLQARQPNPCYHPCLYAPLPYDDSRTNHCLWQTEAHINTPQPYVYLIGLECIYSQRPKDR